MGCMDLYLEIMSPQQSLNPDFDKVTLKNIRETLMQLGPLW